MRYLTLLSFILSFGAYAQNDSQLWIKGLSPNYKKIEKNISKKKSEFYYPLLVERFKAADTTLSQKELQHLYYGFQFESSYAPYGSSTPEEISEIWQKDSLNKNDLVLLDSLCIKHLDTYILDLRIYNKLMYVQSELGKEKQAENTSAMFYMLVKTILYSGSGTSLEDPFYVLYIGHEYDLINILGFSFGGKQALIDNCDKLDLQENEAGIEAFYFEISSAMNSLKF